MGLKKYLKDYIYNSQFGVAFYQCLREYYIRFRHLLFSDEYLITRAFKKNFGYELDLSNPQTMNEKIQWLKLYDRKDFYTQFADKYAVRSFFKEHFGEKYLIPLIFSTSNWNDINSKNIVYFPCIIKPNHSSGDFVILRDKENINWKELRFICKTWMMKDYYASSLEWPYKNIKRMIIIEKLLQTAQGKIPNDYKLHYINGNLEFVYVSVDREGENKRNIYDAEWNPLYFSWVQKYKNPENIRGREISAPLTFNKMKELGKYISKYFKYVRVDFYDVEGELFFGEIILYHGGGFDVFTPSEYDLFYGKKLGDVT
ncbi:glycosyl transferase [Spirochaetia bacterium]|nr:glycosyl transferase [Spirochaetia bacterium]